MMTLEQIAELRFTVESQLLGVGPADLSRRILIALDELAAVRRVAKPGQFPDVGEFIDRLLSAGWRGKADAQWEGVTKFHAELAVAFGQRHDVSLIGEGDKAESGSAMNVWIVYRKGYEWCETVGVWASEPEADADAAKRNKKAAMAKTSKERLSVYTVKAHKVRGGEA